MGRAGIYVRVSVDRDRESESPDRQLADCRAVADRKRIEVVEVYEDRDASAYSKRAKRPQFDRMLEDVRNGRIDTILFWKLDRITRQGLHGLVPLLDLGVKLISATEEIDTTTAMGEGVAGILASVAKQESQNTSLRVKRARLAAANAGQMSTGGPRPFGYTRAGEVVPEEAEVVREAARRALDGESFRKIAVDLNARGVRTTGGAQWQSSVLAAMLRSPLRAGFVVHRGEIVGRAEQRAILTPDEHQRLVATKAEPRAFRKPYHLLAGVIYCECGGRMKAMGLVMKNGRTFPRYACVKSPGLPNCGGVNATERSTDAFVKSKVFEVLSGGKLRPAHRATSDLDEAQLRRLLADDEAALSDLARMRFVDRVIQTDAEYLAALSPLHERISRTTAALDGLADEKRRVEATHGLKPGSLEELEAWWETATDVERRDAVQQVVERVVVSKAKHRGGNVFDTTRVRVEYDWNLLVRIADTMYESMTEEERDRAERELREVEAEEADAAANDTVT